MENKGKFTKLLLVDFLFIVISFIITFLMFRLWFWLFVNKIILTILICITLSGLIGQIRKAVDDIRKHLSYLRK